MRLIIYTLVLTYLLPNIVLAAPVEVRQNLTNPVLMGTATTKILGKTLYSAELWSNGKRSFAYEKGFALSLTYQSRFKATVLARTTTKELARIEGKRRARYVKLEQRLISCFANVSKGDRITAIPKSVNQIHFFWNGNKRCVLKDPNLTKRFLGIWLGPKTRDPAAAAKLKGVNS